MATRRPARKMRRHIARCDACRTIVESTHPWDSATCGCGALTISGGTARPRVSWTASPGAGWTDLSEYDDTARGRARHSVLHEDRARAESFGDDAARYDRTRPSYPAGLLDDLTAGPIRTAVDVGCGTGVVARLLLERGIAVLGVEPDDRMARVARDSGVDVEVDRFEDWDPRERAFDLVVCGQAWHWVDPHIGAAKAASILRQGGRFSAFWNHLMHPPAVVEAFTPVYERLAPHLLVDSIALGTSRPDHSGDDLGLRDAGGFDQIERRTYAWPRTYTVAQWIDELPTHSGHRQLPAGTLAQLLHDVEAALDAVAPEFTVEYTTDALIASTA